MAISTSVRLKPFMVPNYVIQETPPRSRADGFREAPKFALHELDDLTLQALCDQFVEDVFAKAEKGKIEANG